MSESSNDTRTIMPEIKNIEEENLKNENLKSEEVNENISSAEALNKPDHQLLTNNSQLITQNLQLTLWTYTNIRTT
jgi:hypothetical protein